MTDKKRMSKRHPLHPVVEALGGLVMAQNEQLARAFRALRDPKADWYEVPRPELVPDPRQAIIDAAAALRARNDKVTWETVATEIASSHDLPGGLTEKTVRRWAAESGLPHPSKLR